VRHYGQCPAVKQSPRRGIHAPFGHSGETHMDWMRVLLFVLPMILMVCCVWRCLRRSRRRAMLHLHHAPAGTSPSSSSSCCGGNSEASIHLPPVTTVNVTSPVVYAVNSTSQPLIGSSAPDQMEEIPSEDMGITEAQEDVTPVSSFSAYSHRQQEPEGVVADPVFAIATATPVASAPLLSASEGEGLISGEEPLPSEAVLMIDNNVIASSHSDLEGELPKSGGFLSRLLARASHGPTNGGGDYTRI